MEKSILELLADRDTVRIIKKNLMSAQTGWDESLLWPLLIYNSFTEIRKKSLSVLIRYY